LNIPDGFIPLWQCIIYGFIIFIAWIFTFKWVVETLIKLEKEKTTDKRIFFIHTPIFVPNIICLYDTGLQHTSTLRN
jgi:ABC-type Co2+ transport system permease subunit